MDRGRVARRAALLLRVVLVSALTLAAGACSGWGDLAFSQDRRLTILEPTDLAVVDLPVTVEWKMTEFTPTTDGPLDARHGQFAVLLDRYPMPPGQSLRTFVDQVPACRGKDLCLQPDYLRDNLGIRLTTETSITIESLPFGSRSATDDSHFLSIILLDVEGRRIGESVWSVSFRIPG